MGCVSSSLLNQEDDFSKMGMGMGHHLVSLTSTTYGLLSLDPPPSPMTPPTPPRFTLALAPEPEPEPVIINSWELMAGLDSNSNSNPHDGSFRFSILPHPFSYSNSKPSTPAKPQPHSHFLLEDFPLLCPPDGMNKVVLYTTSIRGVRNTFEACNAVRSALQSLGFSFCERDISMDRGFRDDLQRLFINITPPRLFIKGRYLGSADEVLRIHQQGRLPLLLQGLPRLPLGTASPCDGCGDALFLPCFRCNGSCKLFYDSTSKTRCPDCNENGLVLCPICS